MLYEVELENENGKRIGIKKQKLEPDSESKPELKQNQELVPESQT